MEFKYLKDSGALGDVGTILIESQWNLNAGCANIIVILLFILIESQWNLNSACKFAVVVAAVY